MVEYLCSLCKVLGSIHSAGKKIISIPRLLTIMVSTVHSILSICLESFDAVQVFFPFIPTH